MKAADLPVGAAPPPVEFPHFPDALHACIWRNWPLVPTERLAKTLRGKPEEILKMGKAMGLGDPPVITPSQQRRSALTIIRRNWHLLPYEQLLTLLDWTPEQLDDALREDDFLWVKLGNLKPKCEPVRYEEPDEDAELMEGDIARIVREQFLPTALRVDALPPASPEPLFAFVEDLSKPLPPHSSKPPSKSLFSPRFCYSYFALYGDPLLPGGEDPYPDGLLARMADAGVDGVWLQGVLHKLAPFPWDSSLSARHEERLVGLRLLTERAKKFGIGVYLYLNEPRARPLAFFESHPEIKGVAEGDNATLCTSEPTVQKYLTSSVATICRAAPELAGFFTITASENLTNCWSHGNGKSCPRCSKRTPAEVIAEVNSLIHAGIREAQRNARLIAWDWGWGDDWAPQAIERLPQDVALQSVSEWSLPIERGGVKSTVGEYSISAIGPGPRARKHWEIARKRGLKTIAKIQAGCTWELSAVPYIPAVANVAHHVANLRGEKLNGLMLGWTLGGYPSPNLEVAAEVGSSPTIPPEEAMERVAARRFGAPRAAGMVLAWERLSKAFSEFPYNGGLVYNAPMQLGPANLFWAEPTGYRATMVGFPYDDLDGWRCIYPADVFIQQFEKVADGFDAAVAHMPESPTGPSAIRSAEDMELARELDVARAAAIHFRSTANQARFILARRGLAGAHGAVGARAEIDALEKILSQEIQLARRLYAIQSRDSRIGFEASNQYYYVPADLMEKVLNCFHLLSHWLPAERAKWGIKLS